MKNCPVCQRTFPDEYSFCLTDGTPLDRVGDLSDEPTIVSTAPFAEDATVVKERPAPRRSRGRALIIFVLAALLSLSLGITAAVLYYFWPRQNQQPQIATASPSPTASTTATPVSPTPRPTTPKPIASPSSTPTERPNDTQTSDPGTTRISFAAGRAQETIGGTLNNQRSFVLSARPGQTLSAQVNSNDDCVNFASGDAAVRFETQTGDNSITIINSCDHPARFSLTVSIR